MAIGIDSAPVPFVAAMMQVKGLAHGKMLKMGRRHTPIKIWRRETCETGSESLRVPSSLVLFRGSFVGFMEKIYV